MKKNYLRGIATLSAVLLLAGRGSKSELTSTEYCEQNGWISKEWVCLLEDEPYCEEGDFANGRCEIEENVHGVADETAIAEYCVDKWGEIRIEDDSYLCMFDDGSYCEVKAYFTGECVEGEVIYNSVDEEETEGGDSWII